MPFPGLSDLPPPPAGKEGWPWTAETAPAAPSEERWPRITVVTPSFNQVEFLEATIRSVLLQGYPDLEYMVMDGGSTDGSREIIRRYQAFLTHWVSEPDRGQSHAINKGLFRATGALFGYLNSDDVLAPGGLASIARAFRSKPDAHVYYGRCRYIDREGRELYLRQGVVRSFTDYLRIWNRLERAEHLTQPEVFCHTALLHGLGGFREDLHSLLDYEMWLRILANGCQFSPVDAVVAHFRTYGGQKSQRADRNSQELARIVLQYLHRSSDQISPAESAGIATDLAEAVATWQLHAAAAAMGRGDTAEGWRCCVAALRSFPAIAGTYRFWTSVAGPVKRRLPVWLRDRVRGALAKTRWYHADRR